MAAARAALLAVLAFVVATHADDAVILRNHKTVVEKSTLDALFNDDHEHIIPSGQCVYYLRLQCPFDRAPRSVRVTVHDTNDVRVEIDEDLRYLRVIRAYPCLGEATVKVELDCRPWIQTAPNVNEE